MTTFVCKNEKKIHYVPELHLYRSPDRWILLILCSFSHLCMNSVCKNHQVVETGRNTSSWTPVEKKKCVKNRARNTVIHSHFHPSYLFWKYRKQNEDFFMLTNAAFNCISQRGTKSLSRTFTWTVPSWWNDLPISIRTAESLAIFKKHLKTHLFRQHLTN